MNKAGIYKSLLLALGFSLISSYAVSREISEQPASLKDTRPDESSYYYNTEGRWDPFKPFVTPKSSSPTQDPNEIMDEGKELVGMQLFEPGQLTLVGVMLSLQEPLALVEDQTRKGYVLKIGNLIGRRGCGFFNRS
jgi:type IV pilus assembly protein PilP